MDLAIWKRTFKTQEEYELARLEIMIKLTERAISPANLKSEDYLRNQLQRLNNEADLLRKKVPQKKKVDKKRRKR